MAYAFAVPIPPGKADAVRAFFAEILGPRKADYDDVARRSAVTEEYYWLQADPTGDLLVVSSNSDQQEFLALMAHPETDFDRWLADQIRDVFEVELGSVEWPTNEPLGHLVVDG